VRGRMIQAYDLLTALDLDSLMLLFWFTLLFDLPLHHERRGGDLTKV
jgi:hypothetical protein